MDWNRISRLVPMLSSDKHGEVVAAVNAIGRVLVAGGGTWHDLAKRVDGAACGGQGETKQPPYTKKKEEPTRTVYVVRTYDEMVETILRKQHHKLNKWEFEFCVSLRDQLRKSPSLSAKQERALVAIAEKFGIILS